MRKLIVAEQISLDGVIQSPGGPKEDPSGDFRLGGWIVPYADELIGQALQDLLAQPFELLLGRRTYEIFAAYWPRKGADSGSHLIADRFNSVPKHVATHRSDALAWQNSHALKGDLADAIRTLKHQDGPNLLTWVAGIWCANCLQPGWSTSFGFWFIPSCSGAASACSPTTHRRRPSPWRTRTARLAVC